MVGDIIIKLKKNIIARTLIFPVASIKKKIEHRKYLATDNPEKLKKLINIHKGKRCFIVGNGSSLLATDLDKLKDEITFGCNRIYNIFTKTNWRPTYYLIEDKNGMREMLPNIIKWQLKNCIFNYNTKNIVKDKIRDVIYGYWYNNKYVINIFNDKTAHISEDISDHISIGHSVVFGAIQFAIYMGFTKIYLLGVDFFYANIIDKKGKIEHFDNVLTYFDGKERKSSSLYYESVLYAYNKANIFCREHNIKIVNLTRGSRLEVFEKDDFDKIV